MQLFATLSSSREIGFAGGVEQRERTLRETQTLFEAEADPAVRSYLGWLVEQKHADLDHARSREDE